MLSVLYLSEAELERSALPPAEIDATINVDAKLRTLGPALGLPTHNCGPRCFLGCGSSGLVAAGARA